MPSAPATLLLLPHWGIFQATGPPHPNPPYLATRISHRHNRHHNGLLMSPATSLPLARHLYKQGPLQLDHSSPSFQALRCRACSEGRGAGAARPMAAHLSVGRHRDASRHCGRGRRLPGGGSTGSGGGGTKSPLLLSVPSTWLLWSRACSAWL